MAMHYQKKITIKRIIKKYENSIKIKIVIITF